MAASCGFLAPTAPGRRREPRCRHFCPRRSPPPPPPPPTAWADAVGAYLQACRDGWHPPGPHGRLRRLESLAALKCGLARVAHYGHFTQVSDLTTASVTALVRTLETTTNTKGQPFRHSSICTWRGFLRTFCTWAVQQGLLREGAVVWARYPRRHQAREARATLGDLDRALAAAPEHFRGPDGAPCRPVLLLMRYLGLRRMGVARLPRAAFRLDGDDPHVEVDPHQDKASGARTLPLDPAAAAELRDYFARFPCAPADLPFGRRTADGRIVHRGTIDAWRRFLDRAGVPRNLDGTAGLHRIRKASMSAMFDRVEATGERGASWRVAKDLAGVSAATLDTYLRRSSYAERDAARLRAPGQAGGPPLQLAFAFAPGGITAELREADGRTARCRLLPGSEVTRRVLHLVDDCRSLEGAIGINPDLATLAPASPKQWRQRPAAPVRARVVRRAR